MKKQFYFSSVSSKLIISFLVVLSLSFSLWLINSKAFYRMNEAVNALSTPDGRKDSLLVFKDQLIRLSDEYRLEALEENDKPSAAFLQKLDALTERLEQLRRQFKSDEEQLYRLDQIDSLLTVRERLYEKYLLARYNFVHNGIVDRQFEELAREVEKNKLKIDSNFVTTTTKSRKYTYDYTNQQQEEKRGLFRRKRKTEPVEQKPSVVVVEKTEVQVDTLSTTHQRDSILQAIRNSLDQAERERKFGLNYLKEQEELLLKANEVVYANLMLLLNDLDEHIEKEVSETRLAAVHVVNHTVSLNKLVLMAVIGVAFLLAALVVWDVFRMNRYRLELEEAKQLAEFHSLSKQRFLANMSHEIRSPLQSIIGFSTLLAEDPDSNREYIQAIGQSSRHLLHVVNEILDYSKLISGKMVFREEEIELLYFLQEIASWTKLQCREKGLDCSMGFEGIDADTVIVSDSFRIRQLLINLLGNALKFTEKGYVSLHVQLIRNQEWENLLEFTIADTGVGISESEQQTIFNQFEQASHGTEISGTGLGLSIVREITANFNGTITLESSPGIGSAFQVAFPVKLSSKKQSDQSEMLPDLPSSIRIWVIDDDPLILKYCRILFQNNPLVRFFSSGEDLLTAIAGERPDVLLADIRMPELNGMELSHQIRVNWPEVKLVALTAQVLPEEKDAVLESGFDAVVLKPFSKVDLWQVLTGMRPTQAVGELYLEGLVESEEEMQAILQLFREESLDDVLKLEQATAHWNTNEIRLILHRLAGRFAQLGVSLIAAELRTAELQVSNLTQEEIRQLTLKISNYFDLKS